jgi:glycosyltransferase involved in cell wall biosynthesis
MMHIALNGWFWDRPDTGSGQYLHRLLEHLALVAPDMRLTLVLPPHIGTAADAPPGVDPVTTGEGGSAGRWAKVWFEQRGFPRAARQAGADLAHVPYWGPPLASPVPLVTSVLDVIPLLLPDYARGLPNRLYGSLASAGARGSDHIITLSETAKIDIEETLAIPPERISAIYLAPDRQYHHLLGAEHDEDIRARYGLPDQFILYAGGFDQRKRVGDLLEAYTYIARVEDGGYPLVIAGAPPPWGQSVFPDLPAQAEALGIAHLVHWIGRVEPADMPALYRLADVFVYPSQVEGFGLPPLEAMASGTPVVTSDADIFAELLGDGAYTVATPREMAGAIIATLTQEPLRQALINQGLAQATRYQWRRTAQQTLAVYAFVLESARQG